jgi:hypothetical protein
VKEGYRNCGMMSTKGKPKKPGEEPAPVPLRPARISKINNWTRREHIYADLFSNLLSLVKYCGM